MLLIVETHEIISRTSQNIKKKLHKSVSSTVHPSAFLRTISSSLWKRILFLYKTSKILNELFRTVDKKALPFLYEIRAVKFVYVALVTIVTIPKQNEIFFSLVFYIIINFNYLIIYAFIKWTQSLLFLFYIAVR